MFGKRTSWTIATLETSAHRSRVSDGGDNSLIIADSIASCDTAMTKMTEVVRNVTPVAISELN